MKKIVLLDPALGAGLQADSLSSISLPSLIIGAANNDFLPWANHGARYAAGIPNSRTIALSGQEGHFVFLSPCRHKAQVMGIQLCEDRPGVDRAAVHRDLARRVVEFVKLDNEPVSVASQTAGGSRVSARYAHSSTFFQILLYTPTWVFVLLAGLCVFGVMQARTRRVAVWLALLLPAAMPILSLSGVLQYVGLWWPALMAWLLGIAATSMLCQKTMSPETARYDAESRKLLIAGSWIPMLVILGIFVVRYAMGVGLAMQIELARDAAVQLGVSLLLGGFSGFFFARGLMFWRIYAARGAALPAAV